MTYRMITQSRKRVEWKATGFPFKAAASVCQTPKKLVNKKRSLHGVLEEHFDFQFSKKTDSNPEAKQNSPKSRKKNEMRSFNPFTIVRHLETDPNKFP